jgi:hypothetical protein
MNIASMGHSKFARQTANLNNTKHAGTHDRCPSAAVAAEAATQVVKPHHGGGSSSGGDIGSG